MTDAPEETPETDEESEEVLLELKSEQGPPQRRIGLSCGEQSVEVIGPDDLSTLATVAAELWRITTPPRTARIGFTAGETLYTERATAYELAEQDEQENRTR